MSEPGAAVAELDRTPWLGEGLTRRLRLPGPPLTGRPRAPRIGSIASSSSRFARSLARPVPTRYHLRGPETVRVNSYQDAEASALRWWSPYLMWLIERMRSPDRAADPGRGLPRAVHRIPNDKSWTPGGVLDSLVSKVAPVRRLSEVTAAGPMLTSHDRAKLTAPAPVRPAPPAAPVPPPVPPRLAEHRREKEPAPEPTPEPVPEPTPVVTTEPTPVATWKPALPSQLAKATQSTHTSANPLRARERANAISVRERPTGLNLAGGAVTTLSLTGSRVSATSRNAELRRAVDPDEPVRPSLRISDFSTAAWLMPSWSLSSSSQRSDRRARTRGSGRLRISDLSTAALMPSWSLSQRTRAQVDEQPAEPEQPARPTALLDAGVAPPPTVPVIGAHRGKTESVVEDEPTATVEPSRSWKRATPTALQKPEPPSARKLDHPAWEDEAVRTPAKASSSPFNWGTGAMALLSAKPLRSAPRKNESSPFSWGTAGLSLLSAKPLASRSRKQDQQSAINPASAVMSSPVLAARTGIFSRGGLFGDKRSTGGEVGSTRDSLRESAQRTSAVGMTELATTGTRRRANAQSESMLLATAFGAAEHIRPSTAGAEVPPTPTRKKGGGLLSGLLSSGKGGVSKLGMDRSKRAEPAGTSLLGRPRSNAVAPLPFLPAPPPVSLQPERDVETGGAPLIPASASVGLVPGPDGKLRRSLIDTTAALFAAKFGAAKAAATSFVDDLAGQMNNDRPTTTGGESATGPVTEPARSVLDDSHRMQELVDKVVERIENKVIDELERRGRRHNPGVF